ncbi:ankyrin repeat-containing domain protein [Hypoxylon cercidicola]|nr:ankyrin repeat-containing domain protein [Hypoxylon cercidicola]
MADMLSRSSTITKELLERGYIANGKEPTKNVVLGLAASDGLAHLVRLFIKEGADGNAQDEDGLTAVHKAARGGSCEVMSILYEANANVSMRDKQGHTPIHYAAASGQCGMITLLVTTLGADVQSKDDALATPLHLAAHCGQCEIIKLLHDLEADVCWRDKFGQAPIHSAAAAGQLEAVQLLVQLGSDVTWRTSLGRTVGHLAAQSRNPAILEYHGLTANHLLMMEDKKYRSTMLHLAVEANDYESVEALLCHNVNVDRQDRFGHSAVALAARQGNLEILRLLADNDASLQTLSLGGNSPIHLAARKNHLEVMHYLLENDVDIEFVNKKGETPLHIASRQRHHRLGQKTPASRRALKDQEPRLMTNLITAARNGNVAEVTRLINEGLSIDALDLNGRSAISTAAEKSHGPVLNLLIDSKANLDRRDVNGESPLWWAARYGHEEIVRSLLAQGVDVDAADSDGQTPLSVASQKGFEEIVRSLLEKGGNPNSSASYGKTALLFAAAGGHCRVVKLLIEHGADIDYVSPRDETALSLATKAGHTMVVKMLIEMGTDIHIKDNNGRTALSYAKELGNEPVVKLLSQAATLQQANGRASRKAEQDALNKTKEYEYRPLKEGYIRILELEPGREGDIISFKLYDADLSKNPPFEALSYEWKEKSGTVEVQGGRPQLLVTANYNAALKRIRHETEWKRLWIDAIWLRKDVNGSSWDHFAIKERNNVQRLVRDVIEDQVAIDSLRSLLFSEYFKRAWIFQEIMLAGTRGLVICGQHQCPWQTFKAALIGLTCALAIKPPFSEIASFYQIVQCDDALRQLGHLELFNTSRAMTAFKASDARDKVFATLRLASVQDKGHVKRPVADYTLTVQEVYVNASRYFIDVYEGMAVWDLTRRPSAKASPNLPSWAADFTRSIGDLHSSPFKNSVPEYATFVKGRPTTTPAVLRIDGCLVDKVVFKVSVTNGMDVYESVKLAVLALGRFGRSIYDPYLDYDPDPKTKKRLAPSLMQGEPAKRARHEKRITTQSQMNTFSEQARQISNGHAILDTIFASKGVDRYDKEQVGAFLGWKFSTDDMPSPAYSGQPLDFLQGMMSFWEARSKARGGSDLDIGHNMEDAAQHDSDLVYTESGYFGLTNKGEAEEGLWVAIVGGSTAPVLLREKRSGEDAWYELVDRIHLNHCGRSVEKLEDMRGNVAIRRLEIR